MDRITGSISAVGSVTGTLSVQAGLTGTLTVPMVAEAEYYEGDYEVTPMPVAQRLETANRLMHDDVIVGAIPSNYGLITWDGFTLTVS